MNLTQCSEMKVNTIVVWNLTAELANSWSVSTKCNYWLQYDSAEQVVVPTLKLPVSTFSMKNQDIIDTQQISMASYTHSSVSSSCSSLCLTRGHPPNREYWKRTLRTHTPLTSIERQLLHSSSDSKPLSRSVFASAPHSQASRPHTEVWLSVLQSEMTYDTRDDERLWGGLQ